MALGTIMKIDTDALIEAIESEEYLGYCITCGEEQGGCEPDARNYKCESCNENTVFGAEELLIMQG